MRLLLIACVCWALPPAGVMAQPTGFTLGGHSVAPGQRLDLDLRVPAGDVDPATYIPVTVFHGTKPGPVLAVTMGVHGYEFPAILAGQALLPRIDPRTLTGTVVLVRLVHVEAFEGRTPFVNPHDRKNLNRVFPGREDGTQSERIAWVLTHEVIRRCDLLVEGHAGDGTEWLEAFVGVYGGKLAVDQYPMARRMGLALGFRNVVTYAMDSQAQIDGHRSLNRQAVAEGKPTVLIEIGENGRSDAAFVEPVVSGIENLLRELGMAPGAPRPARSDTRWFEGTVGVHATATGILTPAAVGGRQVRKGDLLATTRDYLGRELERLTAPADGYALYGLIGPPVKAGDPVVTIARPR